MLSLTLLLQLGEALDSCLLPFLFFLWSPQEADLQRFVSIWIPFRLSLFLQVSSPSQNLDMTMVTAPIYGDATVPSSAEVSTHDSHRIRRHDDIGDRDVHCKAFASWVSDHYVQDHHRYCLLKHFLSGRT